MKPMPEDWDRAVAVVAHPDDLEYGVASAVARWTGQGKEVTYVLATRGDGCTPAVRALLDAWDEAEAEVLDPARRDDVVALLGRQTDTDAEIAEAMYETVTDPVHGLCAGGQVEPEALEAVLRLRADQGGFEQPHDLAALARPGGGLVRPRSA